MAKEPVVAAQETAIIVPKEARGEAPVAGCKGSGVMEKAECYGANRDGASKALVSLQRSSACFSTAAELWAAPVVVVNGSSLVAIGLQLSLRKAEVAGCTCLRFSADQMAGQKAVQKV